MFWKYSECRRYPHDTLSIHHSITCYLILEKDTFVGIHLGQLVVTQRYRDVLRLGSNLNDAEWKNFTLAISAHGRIEAFVGK